MNQRAHQRLFIHIQLLHQLSPALTAMNILIYAEKHVLNLLIKFGTVGHDHHT